MKKEDARYARKAARLLGTTPVSNTEYPTFFYPEITYNWHDMSEGLLKRATAVWLRPPGPLGLTVTPGYQERLTGMTDWAPRETVQRASKGLESKRSVDDIAKDERRQGLLRHLATGGLMGGVGGGALGRLIGGRRVGAPFAQIARSGLNLKTLKGLKGIPRSARALLAGGAGVGLLGGGIGWAAGAGKREDQARQAARGLLAERVLQRNALREAVQTEQPYTAPLLQGTPVQSASMQTPYAIRSGHVGF